MIFKTQKIRNFMIIEKADLVLEDRGLVLVTGGNLDSSAFDSNGSGKSTLFEAIVWCLWGTTLRGLKADEVLPRWINPQVRKSNRSGPWAKRKAKFKGCLVELEIEDEETGVQYLVRRTRSHPVYRSDLYLEADGKDIRGHSVSDTQSKLDSILDIDLQTFSNSVLFGQGLTKKLRKFSEMTDAEQKDVLELVLGLQQIAGAGKRARASLSECKKNLAIGTLRYNQHVERRDLARDELYRLEEVHANFEEQRAKELNVLLKRRSGLQVAEENTWGKIPEVGILLADMDKLKARAEVQTKNMNSCEDSIFALKAKVGPQIKAGEDRLGELRGERNSLRAQIKKMMKGEGVCPSCRQPATKEHLSEERSNLTKEVADLTERIDALSSKLDEVEDRLIAQVDDLEETRSAAQGKATYLLNEKQTLKLELHSINVVYDELTSHAKSLSHVEDDIEKTKTKSSGLEHVLTQMRNGLAVLNKEAVQLKAQITRETIESQKIEFWVEAFGTGGIRSLVLDGVVPFLNERANRYASILTDDEITVEFNTQTKLKNGEWRDKFQVLPHNKNGALSYAGNSGGERRRIDVSVALALCDLVASRAKKKFNILLLDEVFENLDESGVQAVMALLSLLEKERESIFVITHLEGLQSQFPEEIRVDRRNGRSSVSA
jgi:DNA repair exonuclease SbcCD ATPase subunit